MAAGTCCGLGFFFFFQFSWQGWVSGLAEWKDLLESEKSCPANTVTLCEQERVD